MLAKYRTKDIVTILTTVTITLPLIQTRDNHHPITLLFIQTCDNRHPTLYPNRTLGGKEAAELAIGYGSLGIVEGLIIAAISLNCNR